MFFSADNMMRFAFSEQLDDNDYEPGYALMGIPFDSTTSYRAGSRYGPKAIREASYNFEAYNLRYDTSLSCYNYDIGDVQVNYGNYEETDYMIKDTVLSLIDMGLSPIAMGGEHTITAGVLGAIHDYDEEYFNDLTVIHFDAHFDMRDTYLGEIYSHASVLRRVHEMNPKEIIQLGIRSAEYDEYQYVKSQDNISYYTSQDIQDDIDDRDLDAGEYSIADQIRNDQACNKTYHCRQDVVDRRVLQVGFQIAGCFHAAASEQWKQFVKNNSEDKCERSDDKYILCHRKTCFHVIALKACPILHKQIEAITNNRAHDGHNSSYQLSEHVKSTSFLVKLRLS